uniref:TBP-like 1 n=1 Tax=Sinocyclocheilus grahami TaxID=75366 RepID=A0A672N3N2_SINGR
MYTIHGKCHVFTFCSKSSVSALSVYGQSLTHVVAYVLWMFFQKVLMKLRKPRITATIWSSGKIICTGATSEEEAKLGARRLARCLQKIGFKVRFSDFKVVNVLAVCSLPFQIRLIEFTKNNRPIAR